jgi:nucleoside-diphosphate-sugar epimerase
MNILITGIHGFVGSNLVASLQNQHNIFGLDIVSSHNPCMTSWGRYGVLIYSTFANEN